MRKSPKLQSSVQFGASYIHVRDMTATVGAYHFEGDLIVADDNAKLRKPIYPTSVRRQLNLVGFPICRQLKTA